MADKLWRVTRIAGFLPASAGLVLTIVGTALALGGAALLRPLDAPPAERPGIVTVPGDAVPARRVVSLIPAATEILFALGAGDRIVGRTRWGRHPPEAVRVPDVGDGIRPSLEAVLARDPDLVVLFAGPDNEGVAERLEALGVATLALEHNSLADFERNVGALGAVVGCETRADELLARVASALAAVAASVSDFPRPTVYYDVWSDPPMTIGRGSYLDSLVTLAGGRNAFGDLAAPSPRVSLESIVHRDPAVILYPVAPGSGDEGTPPSARPGWEAVPAVAAGRVRRVNADLVHRLGPRVGEAARELALALHPSARVPALAPTGPPAPCPR